MKGLKTILTIGCLGACLAVRAQQPDLHPAETPAAPTAETAAPAAAADSVAVERASVNELRARRGLVDPKNLFVPEGQWVFGGSASYSTHSNDRYTFFLFENIDSKGYTFKITPLIGYAVRNNSVVGARFIYGRSLLRVDGGEFNIGDEESGTHLTADYYYSLKHSYTLAAVWRQYIPLGRNKRFALFNEMSLAFGGHQAKFAANSPVRGTYETGYSAELGVSPGLIAFATNTMAIEVNVGVMGISYSHTNQTHNRVRPAEVRTSYMNFKVNLLSIGLGVSFYL